MKIAIPELSIVVLVGASGSGKSTFARKHFLPTEVLSSDYFRGLVSDDETNQGATADAFETLGFVAAKRLTNGRLTVVDATNVQEQARKPLLALARDHDVLSVAIVLNLPEKLCWERTQNRPDRDFGPHVVRNQTRQLRQSLRQLQREGFRYVHVLNSPEEVEDVVIERQPLWTNRTDDHGPFDIIGDVHGCYKELAALLAKLGYEVRDSGGEVAVTPPAGRKAIFLGDLVDRGRDTPRVLRLAMSMVRAGTALCVPGNHDVKLMRKLRGRNVQVRHGLAESLEQLEREPESFREEVAAFIDSLVSHYVLDEGRLVVAHAGLKQAYQGRSSGRVRDFALYGETTGETDEYGLPIRYNWAAEYRGSATVVYGHTAVAEPEWQNRTICIDTGCVYGGRLTALRYPENELVSVPAAGVYYEPVRPLSEPAEPAARPADLLDIEDVRGKRVISTRLHGKVTVREENAAAALEVMSRFAVDPRWLIYLPPTMSPSETSSLPAYLEYPDEAFAYYRSQGVEAVVCEEKHMGSRAIVVVCKSPEAAAARFGVESGDGIVFTRTGRRFFADRAIETEILGYFRTALDREGFWAEFNSDWFCFDCEIMPWSFKAEELIAQQYAPTGVAARAVLPRVAEVLSAAAKRGLPVDDLLGNVRLRDQATTDYIEAYRRYIASVESASDIRVAPFHLLASEGRLHSEEDHIWHIETLGRLAGSEGVLTATSWVRVDLADDESVASGIQWWRDLTEAGGEGMVVKPLDFISRGSRGLLQPALKCRGREYLRIIYGPEYSLDENLTRLKSRNVGAKRSLALREFALGMEGLERFVDREPLWRVHECVFGVLAMESEPVDPRL